MNGDMKSATTTKDEDPFAGRAPLDIDELLGLDEDDDAEDGGDAIFPKSDYPHSDLEGVLPAARPDLTHTDAVRQVVMCLEGDGGECPCCGQNIKVYRRKLNANMSRFLIRLVRQFKETQDWVKYTDIRTEGEGRDYSYITKWGLAVTAPAVQSADKKDSGFWKPTEKGIQFALGLLKVPSHVYLYDNKVIGWEQFPVDIQGALGKKWSWQELMHGA